MNRRTFLSAGLLATLLGVGATSARPACPHEDLDATAPPAGDADVASFAGFGWTPTVYLDSGAGVGLGGVSIVSHLGLTTDAPPAVDATTAEHPPGDTLAAAANEQFVVASVLGVTPAGVDTVSQPAPDAWRLDAPDIDAPVSPRALDASHVSVDDEWYRRYTGDNEWLLASGVLVFAVPTDIEGFVLEVGQQTYESGGETWTRPRAAWSLTDVAGGSILDRRLAAGRPFPAVDGDLVERDET